MESSVPPRLVDSSSLPRTGNDKTAFLKLRAQFYGNGDKISAVTNKHHIGKYVARVIADPRTMNQYVFVCQDEVTLSKTFELASRASGEELRDKAEVVSDLS